MSETATETETTTVDPTDVFGPILAKTGQPEQVTAMVRDALQKRYELVTRYNARVLQIQATKATDPNNVDVLDGIRRTEPALADDNAAFEAIAEEYERALAALREKAKAFVKTPLTPEQVESERKSANEEFRLIEADTPVSQTYAGMAEAMLKSAGIENADLLGMIPEIQSLKNVRAKGKTAASGTGAYRTRFDSVSIDGRRIEKTVSRKGETIVESNLILAAAELNRMWNAETLPQNAIDDETLEKAMYASQGKSFRDSLAVPDEFDFEFTKEIAVQQTNDDSVKTEPHTVKISVVMNRRKDRGTGAEKAEGTESTDAKSSDEKPAESATNADAANAETAVKAEDVKPDNAPAAPVAKPATGEVGPKTAALKAKQEAMKAQQAAK